MMPLLFLPSSVLDRGEARTDVAEQKRRDERQTLTLTAGRAGGGEKWTRCQRKGIEKLRWCSPPSSSEGLLYPCEPEGCRFT